MTLIVGAAIAVLGLAAGFIIGWALNAGTELNLIVGLLLVFAGAVVGFVGEWLIDEAYRKNRELRRQLNEKSEVAHIQATAGAQQRSDPSSEMLVEFLQQRDEEIRDFRRQLTEAHTQMDLLRDELDDYRSTHPDDLTVIKGIGSVYQWKLRDAGISSFKQLASADPQQLQRMLGVKEWQQVTVESWIEQARDWARRSL